MISPAATLKFRVTGMDCASCAGKIETAVKRVAGGCEVQVGINSGTLSVKLADISKIIPIENAVKDLGYGITPMGITKTPPAETVDSSCANTEDNHLVTGAHNHSGHGRTHSSQCRLPHDRQHAPKNEAVDKGHDHADHALPIDGAWWQSSKGKTVIFSGILIAAAFTYSRLLPNGAQLLFIVACTAGAIPVVRRALSAARYGSLFTIEMLMTIAVVGAMIIGAIEEAALVVFLFAVGELLEGYAAGQARSGIKALAAIAPKTAMLETPRGIVETPVDQIGIGSTIVVRPGDRIAADGTVSSGSSAVDESALTGESIPRCKKPGDIVLAGSINTEAILRCRVDKPAEETLISRVVKLVEEAADAKAPTERFIDKFSRYYMPIICVFALAVALIPPLWFGQPWMTWVYRALALLLIGCPCALVISTPASIASALAAGARRGLLVKGGGVLEAIGKVKAIAFDKTGTLTEGKPKVTDILQLSDIDEEGILRIAASVEAASSHPLAVAIVNHAKERQISFVPAVNSQVIPGKGVKGIVGNRRVAIGAPGRLGIQSADVLDKTAALENQGKSVSVLEVNRKPIGLIALRDEPRADAAEGLNQIKRLGIKPIILTGDNRANGEAIGAVLDVEVKAELLPEDKLRHIKSLAEQGAIAKVGDGVNDAPALAAATVGIAMGSGTDVALEAADAAVLNNRIVDVARLVKLSRQTMNVIRQNVTIALGLKVVFLVTTVLGMTGLWIAILADTGATVLVTANALRLLRK